MTKEFKIEDFKGLIGKKIEWIEYADADEGFQLMLDDGSIFEIGFSGFEGSMRIL